MGFGHGWDSTSTAVIIACLFIFRGEMRHGLHWTNGWTDKWLDGQMQKRPKSQNPEYSKSREGVIIEWPLK